MAFIIPSMGGDYYKGQQFVISREIEGTPDVEYLSLEKKEVDANPFDSKPDSSDHKAAAIQSIFTLKTFLIEQDKGASSKILTKKHWSALEQLYRAIETQDFNQLFPEKEESDKKKIERILSSLIKHYQATLLKLTAFTFNPEVREGEKEAVIHDLQTLNQFVQELKKLAQKKIEEGKTEKYFKSIDQKVVTIQPLIEELTKGEKDLSSNALIEALPSFFSSSQFDHFPHPTPQQFVVNYYLMQIERTENYSKWRSMDALIENTLPFPPSSSVSVNEKKRLAKIETLLKHPTQTYALKLEKVLGDYLVDIEDKLYVNCSKQSPEKEGFFTQLFHSLSMVQDTLYKCRKKLPPHLKKEVDLHTYSNLQRLQRLKGLVLSTLFTVDKHLYSTQVPKLTESQEWLNERLQELLTDGEKKQLAMTELKGLLHNLPEEVADELLNADLKIVMSHSLDTLFIKALHYRNSEELTNFADFFKLFSRFIPIDQRKLLLYHSLARKAFPMNEFVHVYSAVKAKHSPYLMEEIHLMHLRMLDVVALLRKMQTHPEIKEILPPYYRTIFFGGVEQIYGDLSSIKEEWEKVPSSDKNEWGKVFPNVVSKMPQFYHHFATWMLGVLKISCVLSNNHPLSALAEKISGRSEAPPFYLREAQNRVSDMMNRINQKFNLSSHLIRDLLKGREDVTDPHFETILKVLKQHEQMYAYINSSV